MKTQEIKDLVQEVLSRITPPYPEDITNQVCLAIEQDPSLRREYDRLVNLHSRQVVNTRIGAYTRDLTGLKNIHSGITATSELITTYSRLK